MPNVTIEITVTDNEGEYQHDVTKESFESAVEYLISLERKLLQETKEKPVTNF